MAHWKRVLKAECPAFQALDFDQNFAGKGFHVRCCKFYFA